MSLEPLEPPEINSSTSPALFTATHWTIVLAAGKDDPHGFRALEELCRTYWLPLYSYVRRKGYGPHDAQDRTQGFFARLLRTNSLAGVSRDKGKFRTFLLASLNHFLSDERDRARADKRGGRQIAISLDETEAELRYHQFPSSDLPPERIFDRRWALIVMDAALQRLRLDYESSGRKFLFENLSGFLSREADGKVYDELSEKLGMSAGAVSVAVHRLRQRYRECLRLELAQTVSSPGELDEEMNYLFSALNQ
jgi:RNA polymerase sigma-70 factor (ECF subfamily)